MNFNPRTPCEVRLYPDNTVINVRHFNPRTPCEVRHGVDASDIKALNNFNPRTPCEVRPVGNQAYQSYLQISIHAPHARCDKGVELGYW